MSLQQQLYRQRVLGLMNIPIWVDRHCPTIKIAELIDDNDNAERILSNVQNKDADKLVISSDKNVSHLNRQTNTAKNKPDNTNTRSASFSEPKTATATKTKLGDDLKQQTKDNQTKAIDSNTQKLATKVNEVNKLRPPLQQQQGTDTVTHSNVTGNTDQNVEQTSKTMAFQLLAIGYNDWVLMVDAKRLTAQTATLWQNIQKGLMQQADALRFPLCQGYPTLDMANASLAGFVFKFFYKEDSKLGLLTPLPEGLDHPHAQSIPTLDEMLKQPLLKRQLWHLISQ